MKKVILICSILLTAVISTSFANGNGDNRNGIMSSFKEEFANAQVTKWENYEDYIKITFVSNEQILFAYYSKNAELLAVSRNILSNQLPINLLKSLKKNFSGYWINELFEIDANEETSYYVSLENSDKTVVLRGQAINGWQVYHIEKKILE